MIIIMVINQEKMMDMGNCQELVVRITKIDHYFLFESLK